MSFRDLRVELPTFSQSFHIQVSPSASILNVKEQIKQNCPGAPQVEGQRLIWRGRFLKDEEKVADVWQSQDDSPVVHLAVHPSAWTKGSPTPPTSHSSSTSPPVATPPLRHQPPTPTPPVHNSRVQQSPSGTSLPYITHKHNIAIHALINGTLPTNHTDPYIASLRLITISIVHSCGWSWPSVLDEPYPLPSEPGSGLKYERVLLDNYPYLTLKSPNATPTPIQSHALKVLTHTFALLAIPTPITTAFTPLPVYPNPFPVPPPTNLNDHLREMGLPPLRLAPNQANAPHQNANPNDRNNNPLAGAEIRAIPLRALMMPLMMLTFRTLILMYFFSPSKRPLFGVLLSAWILYEAWGAFRAVLGGEQPGADGQARGGGVDAQGGAAGGQAGGVGPNARIGAAVNGGGGGGTPTQGGRTFVNALMDKLASLNLGHEDRVLHGNPNNADPSVFHRAKSFVVLFVMTFHPAVWDRRRSLLRRREGYVRTEANARNAGDPTDGDDQSNAAHAHARAQLVARYERKPMWVKNYVQRVLNTEWVDEA